MDNTHKTSLVFYGERHIEIEVRRDDEATAWHLTVIEEGKIDPLLSGVFPANFDTDKRTAKEFSQDLVVLLWPSSHVADIARAGKRRNVM